MPNTQHQDIQKRITCPTQRKSMANTHNLDIWWFPKIGPQSSSILGFLKTIHSFWRSSIFFLEKTFKKCLEKKSPRFFPRNSSGSQELRVISEAEAVRLQPLKWAFLVGSVRNPCESPLGDDIVGWAKTLVYD